MWQHCATAPFDIFIYFLVNTSFLLKKLHFQADYVNNMNVPIEINWLKKFKPLYTVSFFVVSLTMTSNRQCSTTLAHQTALCVSPKVVNQSWI